MINFQKKKLLFGVKKNLINVCTSDIFPRAPRDFCWNKTVHFSYSHVSS